MPIRVDDEGFLRGFWPEESENGTPASEILDLRFSAAWFRYCGFSDHDGFEAGADQDTYLRAAPDPPYDWQADELSPGDRLHVDSFEDYESWGNGIGTADLGKPAMATWRSRGSSPPFGVQVVRRPRVSELRSSDDWLFATTDLDFVAWAPLCPNDCATTAFKGSEASEEVGGGDLAYCPRHESLFDPFDVAEGTVDQ